MSTHLALYRKWRPTTFEAVCGQDPITSVLSHQVKTGRISHAYLFCGSRGTGKTSCAKIMARAVNCLDPQNGNPCGKCEACLAIENETATDVLEMDAASNNGVEYIRDIREEVVYTPAMLKNRVYIIDEVHMLSQSAFNALLKTLEEPPQRVIFILATTELHKIPATILSRCQRFDFRRLRTADIADHLAKIAECEGMDADRDALFRIARLASGGMRDAISMLELCAAAGDRIDVELVNRTAGVSDFELLFETVRAVCHKDFEGVFAIVEKLYRASRDPAVFLQDLVGFYRDMLVVKATRQPEQYLELSDRELDRLRLATDAFTKETILAHSRLLDEAFLNLSRFSGDKRLILETALLRLCDETLNPTPAALLARVAALEATVAARPGEIRLAAETAGETAAPLPDLSKESEHAVREREPASAPEEKRTGDAATASATSEKKAEPKAPDATPSRKHAASGRVIPDFIEAINRVASSDASAASILKLARATLSANDEVILTVENTFYRMMLERETVKKELLAALASLDSLKGVSVKDIVVCLGDKPSDAGASELPDLSDFPG